MVAFKGMKPATPAEREFMARVRELPCCLCHAGTQQTRTECHHVVRGNKRLGHYFCLPICESHHHVIKQFKSLERGLWQQTVDQLGVVVSWPQSKICARRT